MSTKAALQQVETVAAKSASIAGPETAERLRAATDALRRWRTSALVRIEAPSSRRGGK